MPVYKFNNLNRCISSNDENDNIRKDVLYVVQQSRSPSFKKDICYFISSSESFKTMCQLHSPGGTLCYSNDALCAQRRRVGSTGVYMTI